MVDNYWLKYLELNKNKKCYLLDKNMMVNTRLEEI